MMEEDRSPILDEDAGDEGESSSSCCGRIFTPPVRAEFKRLLLLIWPLMLSQLCAALIPVVSLVFCGQLGAESLAAVSLANSVINVSCLSVAMGLATACDTLFAQSYGGSNKKQVGLYLQQSLLLLLIACPPCWAIHLNTESLLRLIGQDQRIARLAGDYLLLYMPAVVLSFLYQALSKYIQNQNIVLPSVLIGIAGNGINALLHWLLVFHLQWGTNGSAVAQVGANFAFCLLTLLYILVSRCYRETWPGWSRDCFRDWGVFLRLALPGMLMLCLEWWCFEVGTVISGTLSTVDLGVQSVIFYMEGVCFQIPVGVSIACSIRVGQLLGGGDVQGAKTSTRLSYFIVCWWAVIAVVLFSACRYQVPRLFSNDPDVIRGAADIFPILAAYCFFESISAVSAGALRGCGRQVAGAVVIFIGYWLVALPIGLPLMLKTPLTVMGLWIGYASGIMVESFAFTFLVATTNWQLEAEQAVTRAGDEPIKAAPPTIAEEKEVLPPSDTPSDNAVMDVSSATPTDTQGAVVNAPLGEDVRYNGYVSADQRPRRLPRTSSPVEVNRSHGRNSLARRSSVTQATQAINETGSDPENRVGRRPTLRRQYSTSNLITALHGRRFSQPNNTSETPVVIPPRERRFSTKYTPQIQSDVIKVATSSQQSFTAGIVITRILAVLISLGTLGVGVVMRLYMRYPYDPCDPWPLGNSTVPPDNTLPMCNMTAMTTEAPLWE